MIVLARHGETPPNREGLLLGRSDPGLTERGRSQARAIARAVRPFEPVSVVTSPLARCGDTAATIASLCGIETVVDDRLVEIDYGEWDGQPLADIPDDLSARWRSDPTFSPPGGESLTAVGDRVGSWCEEQRDAPGCVVAVTHVSPIKAAVAWALGTGPAVAWRMFVEVASISRIAFSAHGPVLVSFNERGHLAELM